METDEPIDVKDKGKGKGKGRAVEAAGADLPSDVWYVQLPHHRCSPPAAPRARQPELY
jgi:hypothetical protein